MMFFNMRRMGSKSFLSILRRDTYTHMLKPCCLIPLYAIQVWAKTPCQVIV